MKMMRTLLVIGLVACLGVPLAALAQDETGQPSATAPTAPAGSQFEAGWNKLVDDFGDGPISNIATVVGANYDTGTKKVGGELLFGYNLPKMDLPLRPYLVPLIGVVNVGGDWYGFQGTVSLNADLNPLGFFDGGATNGFAHDFALTLNGCLGVGQSLAGRQFGGIKFPGKQLDDGQGIAAVTGQGASCTVVKTQRFGIGLWYERLNWTTLKGDIHAGGLSVKYSPKGW